MTKKPMKICTCKKCKREYVFVPGFSQSKEYCWFCNPEEPPLPREERPLP